MKGPDMKAIRAVAKHHPYRMTAGCDDGSAFFVAIDPKRDGVVVGGAFHLTAAKIAAEPVVRTEQLILWRKSRPNLVFPISCPCA